MTSTVHLKKICWIMSDNKTGWLNVIFFDKKEKSVFIALCLVKPLSYWLDIAPRGAKKYCQHAIYKHLALGFLIMDKYPLLQLFVFPQKPFADFQRFFNHCPPLLVFPCRISTGTLGMAWREYWRHVSVQKAPRPTNHSLLASLWQTGPWSGGSVATAVL